MVRDWHLTQGGPVAYFFLYTCQLDSTVMKKFYSLFVFIFLFVVAAQAQVIVYNEDFNNSISGVSAQNFILASADAYSDTLYTGGSYAQTSQSASGQQILVINNSISTLNLQSINITWKEYRSQYYKKKNGTISTSPNGGTTSIPNTNLISLEYSLDGVTYKQVSGFSQNRTKFFSWSAINNGTPIQLPFEVNNKPNVRFRWKISVNNANTDFYAMDDVMVKGTPVTGTSTFKWNTRPSNERPFTASSATSANPYTVDGVTMRWTRTNIGTGTSVESDNVNTTFLKKKTLALIQSGASATTGMQVNLQLGQAVSGLTFTLHDIDRNANQFRDKIEIIGYNGTTAVALTKNNVLTTISNEFSNGFAIATANGVDAKVTSNRADVTVSFVQFVDRVVVKYLNDDAAKGRQGIAIGDISWATAESSITPMPVELASFKAQALNGQAKLTWVTAAEVNNDKFMVERSQDGKNFAQIGEVKGNGNSSKAISYTFTDANPANGTNYYRLRQIDFDGTTAYSNTVALDFQGKFAGVAAKSVLYPTVATDVVNLNLASTNANVYINVIDATGKTVKQLETAADREVTLAVQDLKGGAYFVTVTDGENRETLRFVKK